MRVAMVVAVMCAVGCSGAAPPEPQRDEQKPSVLLITIDTLRADRLGSYGDSSARTPAIDALAARGALFTHAYATAPITLPSHASIMTGRYPPGHGARHNGIRVDLAVPTLAEHLARNGFATAAFVAAFPLDRRFGLIKGFQTYSDQMPRVADGRPANERPGKAVVDDAVAWLQRQTGRRIFLWVHIFEPHAPYGDPRGGGSPLTRYAQEVTEADTQVARLISALGDRQSTTLTVLTSDHGEAFGEHGEVSHSVFVYDTTLRVPLIVAGPGVRAGVRIIQPVALVDLAPTVSALIGAGSFDADGVNLGAALQGTEPSPRALYAESLAPLLDFGWSPLQSIREGGWKYIHAPKPELFQMTTDPNEDSNRAGGEPARTTALREHVRRLAGPDISVSGQKDREVAARLQALGYIGGGTPTSGPRADPKDRKPLAARIAQILSGELQGAPLERALREVLAEDIRNPQANLRLGYVLLESERCREALTRFRGAIDAQLPSADAHLGLAACQVRQRDFDGAATTLRAAERAEPGNPVVSANLGIVLSDGGNPAAAIDPLQRALTIDPNLHQARFSLAIAFARAGRRADALRTAEELLRRLPATAPQRPEVERLVGSLRP